MAINVNKLVSNLGLNLVEYSNRFTGCCPIHKGDNQTAFTIYKETGIWRCFTLGCHNEYMIGPVGLVQAMLKCSKDKAIYYLEDVMGGKLEINSDINYAFTIKDKEVTSKVSRELVRKKLKIPAEYFLQRGYSPEVLDKYDVGLCLNSKSKFANRCVVPIYDINYSCVVGYTGRDITEKNKVKWLHDKFERNQILYNSWFAKKYIEQSNTAILTESPGNVWRLEEAGIHNSLAMFGTNLSFNQMRLISKLGVINLVLMLDNDVAGKEATSKIVERLKGLYNIVIPKISYGDVGECPVNYLQDKILPVLSEL